MKNFLRGVVCIIAVSGLAQSPAAGFRAIGEHRISARETEDSAKQFALIEATGKLWQQVATSVQVLPEVKALPFKPNEIEAFVAATLQTDETSESGTRDGGIYRINVLAHADTAAAAGHFIRLHKDQEAAVALVEIWRQMQELLQQLSKSSSPDAVTNVQELQLTLSKLRVKHLAAQVTARLARTEESLGSARVPAAEGRVQAKRLAESALALAPASPDALYAMGDVLAEAGDAAAAQAAYQKALSTNPDTPSGHTKLAGAFRLQGKLAEAVTELREALRINPDSHLAHTDLGSILAAQGNGPAAISEYREALRLDADFIDAHNGLAIALARQRRIPDAVVEFREIVRIDPDSALGYFNLASALADMDQDQESAAALREVVRINPNHFNAHYNIGELFRLEGKFDESVTQFREYLRLAPDTPQNQRNMLRAKEFIQAHENH